MLAIFLAELKKSHHQNFHSMMTYFSLCLWPALSFTTAYYAFKPFDLSASSPIVRFVDSDQVLLFLLTGYLGYIFFLSLVESAWQMSYERQFGTLETICLSPVSKVQLMIARATSNLIESVWLFTAFTALVVIATGGFAAISLGSVLISFLILFFSAAIWGGFLNALFLFSRDAGFLFTVVQGPMEFFSGVRIPFAALPIWGKVIGYVFPLTYVLNIVRKLLLEGASVLELGNQLLPLLGVLAILLGLTIIIVKKAERKMKRTGSAVLF